MRSALLNNSAQNSRLGLGVMAARFFGLPRSNRKRTESFCVEVLICWRMAGM